MYNLKRPDNHNEQDACVVTTLRGVSISNDSHDLRQVLFGVLWLRSVNLHIIVL